MICANCNAEIKDGSIYCPVCGKEAQIVNGYTSLEDDFLHSLLRDGIEPLQGKRKKVLSKEELIQRKKKRQRLTVIATCLVLSVVITIFIVIKLFIDYKNDNSYDYQMRAGQAELVDHNYESAIEYFTRALAIVPTDTESRIELAKIYMEKEQYDSAVVLLTEVIRLAPNEKEAYQCLINIYVENGQYVQLQNLARSVKGETLKELFRDYTVAAPTFYPEGDTFYSEQDIEMFCVGGCTIFYTTDGSDPIQNGVEYTDEIHLKNSGLYTIRAVSKNENGIFSKEIKESYQIILMPEETEQIEYEDYSFMRRKN